MIGYRVTSGNAGYEYVLEFVCSNHCVGIEIACCGDETWEYVIGDVVECLLFFLIRVHVERITKLCHKYSSSTRLDRIDRRIQTLNLRFPQHLLPTDLIRSHTVANTSQYLLLPRMQSQTYIFNLRLMIKLKILILILKYLNLILLCSQLRIVYQRFGTC